MAVVFLVVTFFAAALVVFLAAADVFFSSAAGASPSSEAGLRQPPRFSSGVKLAHFSLMQKGFLAPRPDFLNIVCPQTGQLSFTGTSQVMNSHLADSSLALRVSQQ